jgi:hypothetical protein
MMHVSSSFYVGDQSVYHGDDEDHPIDRALDLTMDVYANCYLTDNASTTIKYVVIVPGYHISMIAVWA